MLKSFLLVALFLCCARNLTAQEPCRIGRAAAPDYGGVTLGMRPEELGRMFPGSEDLRAAPDAGGSSKPFVASLGMLDFNVRKEEFEGVEELALTFIGGTLQRIDVRFRGPAPWKSIADFSEEASRQLALPPDAWGRPASDAEKQSRVLDCQGFSVVLRIDKGGASTLSIVDTTAAGGEEHAPESTTRPAKRPPRKRGVR